MASSKKRIYIGSVAFCLLALFVDRIVLTDGGGGPSRAEASPTVGATASTLPKLLESQPIPSVAFPTVPKDVEASPPRDFFARPLEQASVGPSGIAPAVPHGERLLRGEFEGTVKLGGVMLTTDGGVAVVNGIRMVRGDSLLGCQLEKVFGRSAHFRCLDGEAVLFIAPRSSKTAN